MAGSEQGESRVPEVSVPRNGAAAPGITLDGSSLPLASTRATATDLGTRQENARRKQTAALETFLDEAAVLQSEDRAARALRLREALDEEVEASRKVDLSELVPFLPADPIQLEMTNLRLLLLENTRLTEAERTEGETRLRSLETQWRQRLRQQEAQRLAQLEALRQEAPLRIRREGEARIATTVAQAQATAAERRTAIRAAQRERVEADFNADASTLGIVLPATGGRGSLASARAVRGRNSSAASLPVVESVETSAAFSSSAGTLQSGAGVQPDGVKVQPKSQTESIRLLRVRATREARRWALVASRRAGWKLQSAPVRKNERIVDGTREALQILNLR